MLMRALTPEVLVHILALPRLEGRRLDQLAEELGHMHPHAVARRALGPRLLRR